MALFYHGLNQAELTLRHMSQALLLLSLSSGPDHPDVAATFINVAMMYQDIGNMNTALLSARSFEKKVRNISKLLYAIMLLPLYSIVWVPSSFLTRYFWILLFAYLFWTISSLSKMKGKGSDLRTCSA
ncbi:hypothetical protein SO802_008434 [Lithocarpus litseifolius]|uniref:Uncharacterized protein n=1 Tax=Lithocarpus litseifolius TaxID=425828 RepID=A0AAW2DAS2_9ROSI